MYRFPEARHSHAEQTLVNEHVSYTVCFFMQCRGDHYSVSWTLHNISLLLTHPVVCLLSSPISAKDQGYSESKSTNLPAFTAKQRGELFISFFRAIQLRKLVCTPKRHKIKTIASGDDGLNTWDWWCMFDEMGQTASGSDVQFSVFLLSHTYGG